VQDIVVGNKNFTDVTKPSEIVQLLLNEDQLTNLDSTVATGTSAKKNNKKPAGQADGTDTPIRDLWTEEGDEFFGQSGAAGGASIQELDDEGGTPVPVAARKKGRGEGTGARRGRKPGPKSGRKRGNGAEAEP
jgi:chromatin-remodeling ATPase INO80